MRASSHFNTIFPSHPTNPIIFPRSLPHFLYPILPRTGRGESQRLLLLLAKKRMGSTSQPRKERKKRPARNVEMAESAALESEILDFMEKSPNPRDFPTKDALVAAGRMDLVEGITARGGWLSFGWDLETEQDSNSGAEEAGNGFCGRDVRIFEQRFSSSGMSSSSSDSELEETNLADSMTPSSSGRSLEMEGAEDAGIEGILNRLNKVRNPSFAVESKEIEGYEGILTKIGDDNLWGFSADEASGSRSSSFISKSYAPSKNLFNDSWDVQQNGTCSDFDGMKSSLKTEMWRTCSSQRAGPPETEFEAAEIVPLESGNRRAIDHTILKNVDLTDEMYTVTDSIHETTNSWKEPSSADGRSFPDQIHSRLQCLELELTSVLCLLRTDSALSHKGHGSSLEEMHELSDALEFKETEIMKARDKLRSTHAKLAVLKGKMTLEIIEAQKMVHERQRRIDDAKQAPRILSNACVVWPTPASEVFLVGSFDGWTNQRRMERSSAGMLSLNLKLYPGRYEIKFIVDGLWTIDPLRPIINNNGSSG